MIRNGRQAAKAASEKPGDRRFESGLFRKPDHINGGHPSCRNSKPKTGINFMEDVVNNPLTNPPEFESVATGGTIINLSNGCSRRVKELWLREKREIFRHPYIVIEDENMDTLEIINTAHVVSVK